MKEKTIEQCFLVARVLCLREFRYGKEYKGVDRNSNLVTIFLWKDISA